MPPFPEIPLNDVVDLTVSADEEESQEYRSSNQFRTTTAGRDKMPPNQTQLPNAGAHGSPSSLRRTPYGTTPTKSSAQHDGTPSKSARFSPQSRREVHASSSAAANASLQPPAHPSNGYNTPKTQTPKKLDWTVDKIAGQLATYAAEVEKVHARVVHYTLQEIFKKAPQPRHLSAIDDFADMPCIAVDSDKSDKSGGTTADTMAVKFKVSAQPNPVLQPSRRNTDNIVGGLNWRTSNIILGETNQRPAACAFQSSASSRIRTVCPNTDSTKSR